MKFSATLSFIALGVLPIVDARDGFSTAAFPISALSGPLRLRVDPPCPSKPSPVPLPNLPPEILEAIQVVNNTLSGLLNPVSLPGISASISYLNEPIWSIGLGVADKSTGRSMTSNTLSRIASISKVFATILAFRLAQDGHLSLDDPIAKFAPAFSIHDPFNGMDGADVTFRQLAAQNSGLQREPPVANTTADVLSALSNLFLILPPGLQPSYSNLGIALLGHVLGEYVMPASSGGYEALVAEYIIGPLGLSNTGFNYSAQVLEELAVGYTPTGQPVPYYSTGWVAPAAEMYSTVDDLNTLAQDIMAAAANQPSKLGLQPAVARQMLQEYFIEPDGLGSWGTPWENRWHVNYTVMNKGGNLAGYSSVISFVPQLQLSVSVIFTGGANEEGVSDTIWPPLLVAFHDVLMPLQAPANPGPAPSQYWGTYDCSPAGIGNMVVSQIGSLLALTFFEGNVPLAFFQPDIYQVAIPSGFLACTTSQFLALNNEYVFFSRNSTGVTGLAMPGFLPAFACAKMS